MDVQTEIKWIQNELNKVRDPDLIEIIKRLLLLRKKSLAFTLEEYNHDIAESEKDIVAGRIYAYKQIENLNTEWKKSL